MTGIRTTARGTLLAVLVVLGLAAGLLAGPATAGAAAGSRWAPAAQATIRPGVQMYTKGAQCTANFVFTDRRGRVYVGYAAHCPGTGEATDTNGCDAGTHPLGTKVRFADGGSLVGDGSTVGRGRLVYSSWVTMQALGTADQAACEYNDFALVRVGRRYLDRVNPSVPFWGGPVGLRRSGTGFGDRVLSYGSSSLRGGLSPLSPKDGRSLGSTEDGWSHTVYTATPGVPGDSGSGFLDGDGRAFGTLSTLSIAPLPAGNGVGDLAHELAFARQHSGIGGLRLVKGTEPFAPPY